MYVYCVRIKNTDGTMYVVGHDWKEARNILKKKTGILIKNMNWIHCDFSKLALAVNPYDYKKGE